MIKFAISLPYFPCYGSGTGNSIRWLTKGLLNNDQNVFIVAEKKWSQLNVDDDLAPVVRVLDASLSYPYFFSKKSYEPLIEENTVFILNGNNILFNFFFARFLTKNNIAYIFFPHAVYSREAFFKKGFIKKIYFHLFEKVIIKYSLATLLLSRSQEKDFRDISKFSGPVIHIPNSLPISILEGKKKKENYRNVRKLLFLGRRDLYIKGLDILIAALSELPSASLSIDFYGRDAGDDVKIQSLLEQTGVDGTLFDHVDGSLDHLYEEYDCLVLPSRLESFSMALVEAASYGMPVIYSNAVGAGSYLDAAPGTTFDPDMQSIKSSLERLLALTPIELEQRSQDLAEQCRNEFNCDLVAKKFIDKVASINV